jgi:hypothetical protein
MRNALIKNDNQRVWDDSDKARFKENHSKQCLLLRKVVFYFFWQLEISFSKKPGISAT